MMNGDIYDNYLDSAENYSNGYSKGLNGNGYATIAASSSGISSSPLNANCPPSSSSCYGLNYIEHRVSKMDTLAGVAIKYGVEVADIRRMNGLVTDLQMFALEILRIPPGRHPPSPVMSNGTSNNGEYQTPPRRSQSDVLDSLQSLKLKPPRSASPAMCTLQGYYNLKTPSKPKTSHFIGETEMSTYRTNRVLCLDDIKDSSSFSEPALSKHRKSRSLVSLENAQENGDTNDNENSVRRRQKCDNGFDSSAPEILIKDESNERGFFGRIGKGLALRPKVGKTDMVDGTCKNGTSSSIGDFFNDVFVAMRKSSSTSNLQESENGSSFAWPTSKWSLKADVISRPILDGLPKPVSVKRNKPAMD